MSLFLFSRLVCLIGLWFICSPAIGATAGKQAVTDRIQVVTSIRPLALIAGDVLGEKAEIRTLVPPNTSPHDYVLKPSQMQWLQEADLVIWLGPRLEQFLVKPLEGVPPSRRLALSEVPDNHPQTTDHGEVDRSEDLHWWLDPVLAQQMARGIGEAVGSVDMEPVLERYRRLHETLTTRFEGVAGEGFVVYHRGYDLLVARYGLRQVGWLTTNPHQPASVRHRAELGNTLQNQPRPVRCLFVGRSHLNSAIKQTARQLELMPVTLDVLAMDSGTASYPQLMESLADAMVGCLEQTSQ